MASKVWRITGWALGTVATLFIVITLAVVLFVDPNDFKDDITQAVQEATGRELELQGDIELSVFPWLGLSLGAAQLSNAAGFEEAVFARVESVEIKFKLLPLLLKQRIEMKTVQLRGLRVNLSRIADGRSNWDDLLAPSASSQSETTADEPQPASPATPLAAVAIGGVNIEDAQIRWDDQQAGQRVVIENLNLRTGPIALREPIDFQLSTQLSLSAPALSMPIELGGRLTLDVDAQRYRLDDLVMSVSLRSDLLPVSPLDVRISASVDAELAQQRVSISGLHVQALGLATKVTLNLQQILSSPQVTGELSVAAFSPRDLATRLGIVLPKTADAKVLTKASLTMDFSGSIEALSVNNLDVMLDDSRLQGKINVQNFAQPALQFELKLDGINADRYLPPALLVKSPKPGATDDATVAIPLPLELLRELKVEGGIKVGTLKLANARVSDIQLTINAKAGQLRLQPLKARLYGGQFEGDISVDVRKDVPRIVVNGSLQAVNVEPLLQDVLGEDTVSGVVSVQAKLRAQGLAVDAIKKTLNGTAQFQFKDGAVKGVNLGQLIREAYAKINQQPKPPKQDNQTDFAEMTGSVNIVNGVVNNDDLRVKSPLLRLSGKGRVDLPRERIDYRINAAIVESDQGQAGKELAELKSLTIPIKVSGTFAKPEFSLDLAPLLKKKAKQELQRQKAKLKEKAKQRLDEEKAKAKKRLKEKLKNKLKGLF